MLFSSFPTTFSFLFIAAFCLIQIGFSQATEWKVSEKRASTANPVTANADSIAKGKKIYSKECASCHGEKGKGDGASSRDFSTVTTDITDAKFAAQTDGAIFYKVTVGRRPMPAFRDTLSDEDRWHVVNFMRTLSTVKK